MLESEQQLGATLHLELHTTGTKDLICRAYVELHVGDVELPLVAVLYFADFLLPVAVHLLALAVAHVLVVVEHVGRSYIHVTNLRVDDVIAVFGVVLDLRGLSVLEVHCTADR